MQSTSRGLGLPLTRYGIERVLYRLSQSERAHHFVPKGATLFSLWTGRLQSPTRDLDLLGHGDSSPKALTRRPADRSWKQHGLWEGRGHLFSAAEVPGRHRSKCLKVYLLREFESGGSTALVHVMSS